MITNPRAAAYLLLALCIGVSSCGPGPQAAPTRQPVVPPVANSPIYKDPSQPVEARVEDLLSRMNLDEKIGQMTQVENNSIAPSDVASYSIGSVLTGGDGISRDNTLGDWTSFVKQYQEQALRTRLGIPLIYGVDSVHGFAHVNGATVFPHNIGLGATRDTELVRKIGQATAEEMLAAGIPWNFGPVVAVPQDIRWGRTYEGFSEDTRLVTDLSAAYIEGFQGIPAGMSTPPHQTLYAGATAKHYLGDGGTQFGTSKQLIIQPYLLDQGDMRYDEATVRALFLPPYEAAVHHGVMSVMISFSSWNGTKMHASKHMITDVLKTELGFKGFVVSDWGGIDQITDDYEAAVISAINAGVDMNMVPYDYKRFIEVMKKAVRTGAIPQERIDDAVRRDLRAKFALGLFEHPYGDATLAASVGSPEHRLLARQAVRESLVLLKNANEALPISRDTPRILVAGRGADSIGMQCGGWTLTWQGSDTAEITGGTSILSAIKAAVSPGTTVLYDRSGQFESAGDIGIVIVGESPYAEGVGDAKDLGLAAEDISAITNARAHVSKLIVVLLSGRPLVITGQLQSADAWVAAWLPGTEGAGVSDVLFGDYPFTGKLPYSWPRSNAQLPANEYTLVGKTGCQAPLFPFGYGLTERSEQPALETACP
ncbi:MAG: glycoside hydrolase family 3 protein [Anaerolineae bacterium]